MSERSLRGPHAQTIPQLLEQLRTNGRAVSDLCLCRDVYLLASDLYAGLLTGSGKTTLAHLIGTASVLDWLETPFAVVIAGLLHSAYISGNFGDGRRGATERKREEVRSVTGPEAEKWIHGFCTLPWTAETVPGISARLDTMSPDEKIVVLLRLADQLDRFRDLGAIYLYRPTAGAKDFARKTGPVLMQMSTRLGYPTLADAFERAFRETLSTELPEGLRDLKWPGGSSAFAPRSHRRRLHIYFRHLYRRARSTARRILK